jgi:hypothetical protein
LVLGKIDKFKIIDPDILAVTYIQVVHHWGFGFYGRALKFMVSYIKRP